MSKTKLINTAFHAAALLAGTLSAPAQNAPAPFALSPRNPFTYSSAVPPVGKASVIESRVATTYGMLPLTFTANRGQTDRRVDFLSRGAGYSLFLTPREAVFSLLQGQAHSPQRGLPANRSQHATHGVALRMQWVQSNPRAKSMGETRQVGIVNCLRRTLSPQINIPTYASVRYRDVYPRVDVRYYGTARQLEYDLLVRPGANVAQIGLRFQGANAVRLNKQGALRLALPGGGLTWKKPAAYQMDGEGHRHWIASRYRLDTRTNTVRFVVGKYDTHRLLVLDPALCYATFLGGSADSYGEAITLDSSGCAYVAGETASPNFPITSGAFQTTQHDLDVFVAKLNPTGTALAYSTFLGGGDTDYANGIAVDAGGNACVVGYTASLDFPVTQGAVQTTSGASLYNAFVAKLNVTGTGLIYSTLLGGTGDQIAWAVRMDGSGNAYVTGNTTSTDFPVTQGAYQTTVTDGVKAFVAKLNAAGTALAFSTYLGGRGDDYGQALVLGNDGSVYVAGHTTSDNFPTTTGAYQRASSGNSAAFVSRLSGDGATLVASTYLDGNGDDYAQGVACDSQGNVYVAGYTDSTNFATPASFQAGNAGGTDGFLVKLNPTLTGVAYSTYLGGKGEDYINALAVDDAGGAVVVGSTFSDNFPMRRGLFRTGFGGASDAFVARFAPDGKTLLYATFLGGKGSDSGMALTLDANHRATVTGYTSSSDFPVTPGAIQPARGTGSGDAFVCQLPTGSPGFDFDGDGHTDLLWRNTTTGDMAVWTLAGATLTNSLIAFAGVPLQWQIVGSGDFNGDGKLDLLWQNTQTGECYVWYLAGGVLLGYKQLNGGLGTGWRVEGCADVDGDGKPDLLWRNTTNGDLYAWFMDGTTFKSAALVVAGTSTVWHVVGTPDLNHDGNPDLVWQNTQTGDVWVWYMSGLARLSAAPLALNVPAGWRVVNMADLDGTGNVDIVWQNTQTGEVAVWYMDGAAYVGAASLGAGIPAAWQVMTTQ